MSSPIEPAPDDELQFKTVEPVTAHRTAQAVALGPVTQGCARCHKPITSAYYAVGQHPICAECRTLLDPPVTGSRFGRLFKAGLFGLGAGLLGALIWYAVRRITNMEIGLVAIVVGFMVGKAVRKGSGNRGGRGYQVMAVILTYCCIAANYMPDIAQMLIQDYHEKETAKASVVSTTAPSSNHAKTSVATSKPTLAGTTADDDEPHERPSLLKLVGLVLLLVVLIFALSLAAPFLMGVQNIIGLLIIGFALWEAWKFNRRIPLPITGPYQVGDHGSVV